MASCVSLRPNQKSRSSVEARLKQREEARRAAAQQRKAEMASWGEAGRGGGVLLAAVRSQDSC